MGEKVKDRKGKAEKRRETEQKGDKKLSKWKESNKRKMRESVFVCVCVRL